MLTRTPLIAALAAISLACAGNVAAQTDVLVVEGTSVGILDNARATPAAPGDLAASRRDEQKYMEIKLKEVLISGVISNGKPVQSQGAHRNEIHVESFSWAASSGASEGPDLMLKSVTGRHLPRGSATDGGRSPSSLPASPIAGSAGLQNAGAPPSVLGGTRAAAGPGSPSMPGQRLPHHAPAFAAPAGRR